ncbi:glutamate receptor ionotropic, kainate 4-like [Oratosquilla oratoria]|uniref:glutamate receptor ionotropic, kainate 4-like n=1 Tax=Oratosquilla oratoria TaxID=337810 RepID=UPI003F75D7EE
MGSHAEIEICSFSSRPEGEPLSLTASPGSLSPKRSWFLACRSFFVKELRLRRIGVWKTSDKCRRPTYFVSENLFPSLDDLYSDFGGRHLVVGAVNNPPFFKVLTHPNGTSSPEYGIDVSALGAMGQVLNFTFGVQTPHDGQWGNPQPDGTITGMIGMVARHEINIAMDEITITGKEPVIPSSYFVTNL